MNLWLVKPYKYCWHNLVKRPNQNILIIPTKSVENDWWNNYQFLSVATQRLCRFLALNMKSVKRWHKCMQIFFNMSWKTQNSTRSESLVKDHLVCPHFQGSPPKQEIPVEETFFILFSVCVSVCPSVSKSLFICL